MASILLGESRTVGERHLRKYYDKLMTAYQRDVEAYARPVSFDEILSVEKLWRYWRGQRNAAYARYYNMPAKAPPMLSFGSLLRFWRGVRNADTLHYDSPTKSTIFNSALLFDFEFSCTRIRESGKTPVLVGIFEPEIDEGSFSLERITVAGSDLPVGYLSHENRKSKENLYVPVENPILFFQDLGILESHMERSVEKTERKNVTERFRYSLWDYLGRHLKESHKELKKAIAVENPFFPLFPGTLSFGKETAGTGEFNEAYLGILEDQQGQTS